MPCHSSRDEMSWEEFREQRNEHARTAFIYWYEQHTGKDYDFTNIKCAELYEAFKGGFFHVCDSYKGCK
jgi:hypothetical protein